MPIYEYECVECDALTEVRMKISDPDPTICEKCGKSGLRKLISQTAFHLKGGGWYNDAYDSKNQIAKRKEASENKKKSAPSNASKKENAKVADTSSSSSGEQQSETKAKNDKTTSAKST